MLKRQAIEIDQAGKKGHRFGTAFLISPCLILTNAHVVYGDDAIPDHHKDYSMVFRAGMSRGGSAAFEGHTIATPTLGGSRNLAGKNDWAVMRLSVCIGARAEIGWFDHAEHPANWYRRQHVEVLGFPGDGSRGELRTGSGEVEGVNQHTGMLTVSASTVPGQSGGPVLVIENGLVRVIGLYTAAKRFKQGEAIYNFPSYSAELAIDQVRIEIDSRRPKA